MALLVFVGVITIPILLGLFVGWLWEHLANVREKNYQKAHPQLWVWFDEVDDNVCAEVHYHNDNITPLKKQIDSILAQWNYYTAETKSQKENELEDLRNKLEIHEIIYQSMCAETQKIRDKIHTYVEENNLEWARKWGW